MLTLPWEKVDGPLQSHKILFRWATDDSFVRYRLYSEQTWKPVLVVVGVIPAPTRDGRGRVRYKTTRKEGPHQLRHYRASIMLADGLTINELAEYMGHHDPAFTLRVYGHMQQGGGEHARAIIDGRMNRRRKVSGGSRLRLVAPDERAPEA